MESKSLPERERRYISETLRSAPSDPERLVAINNHLLARGGTTKKDA